MQFKKSKSIEEPVNDAPISASEPETEPVTKEDKKDACIEQYKAIMDYARRISDVAHQMYMEAYDKYKESINANCDD